MYRTLVRNCIINQLPKSLGFGARNLNPKAFNRDNESKNQFSTSSCRSKFNFNLWQSMNDRYNLKVKGNLMYENIADTLDYAYFFNLFKMKDTFFSWYLVTELHVWMVMLRCMQMQDDRGMKFRNKLLNVFWTDVDMRSKKLGLSNVKQRRAQMAELGESFNVALLEYDEAIMISDAALAGALWRRFFEGECNDPQLVERLIDYVHKQLLYLEGIDQELLLCIYFDIKWDVTLKLKEPLKQLPQRQAQQYAFRAVN